MHFATLGDRKVRLLAGKGEKIAKNPICNHILAKSVRAFYPTCNYSEPWRQQCVAVMYFPPINKVMYSITYEKIKPLDLLEFLLLKIYPNVTEFYPKNDSS